MMLVSNAKDSVVLHHLFGLASARTQQISVLQPTIRVISRETCLYSLGTLVSWQTTTQFSATARIQITSESSLSSTNNTTRSASPRISKCRAHIRNPQFNQIKKLARLKEGRYNGRIQLCRLQVRRGDKEELGGNRLHLQQERDGVGNVWSLFPTLNSQWPIAKDSVATPRHSLILYTLPIVHHWVWGTDDLLKFFWSLGGFLLIVFNRIKKRSPFLSLHSTMSSFPYLPPCHYIPPKMTPNLFSNSGEIIVLINPIYEEPRWCGGTTSPLDRPGEGTRSDRQENEWNQLQTSQPHCNIQMVM